MINVFLCGVIAIATIIILELWQSNKRLKKMLELDKQKMARLFDENIALENKAFNKAFNVARQYEQECD